MPVPHCFAPWSRPSLVLAALLACLSLSAHAAYEYRYDGPMFTMTTQLSTWEPGDPSQGRSFSEQQLSAVLVTDAPLRAGSTLDDVRRFTMTLSPWFGAGLTIHHPFMPEGPIDPTAGVGSPGNPLIEAGISIGGVDDNGLPTDWTMFIYQHIVYPTGRHNDMTFNSSNVQDGLFGFLEPFARYDGQSDGTPGNWQRVVVVPEPHTPLLMLVGIAAMAALMRRRRSARRPGHAGAP